jgi:MFS family permease
MPPFPALLVGAGLLGVAYGPVGPLVASAVQRATPDHLRGRVLAVLTAATYAAGPAGLLASGWAITAFGLRPVFLAVAFALLAAALSTFAVRPLDQLDAGGAAGSVLPARPEPSSAGGTPLPVATRP